MLNGLVLVNGFGLLCLFMINVFFNLFILGLLSILNWGRGVEREGERERELF